MKKLKKDLLNELEKSLKFLENKPKELKKFKEAFKILNSEMNEQREILSKDIRQKYELKEKFNINDNKASFNYINFLYRNFFTGKEAKIIAYSEFIYTLKISEENLIDSIYFLKENDFLIEIFKDKDLKPLILFSPKLRNFKGELLYTEDFNKAKKELNEKLSYLGCENYIYEDKNI